MKNSVQSSGNKRNESNQGIKQLDDKNNLLHQLCEYRIHHQMLSSSELLVKKNMSDINDNSILFPKIYPQTARIYENQNKIYKSKEKKVSFSDIQNELHNSDILQKEIYFKSEAES